MSEGVKNTAEVDMSTAVRKSTRRKKTKTALSTVSSSTASSINSTHPYLGDREISAIENWNDSIPGKNQRAPSAPNDQDSVVQAYLQAKMALFQNLHVSKKQSISSMSTSQGG